MSNPTSHPSTETSPASPASPASTERHPDYVQSLERGLSVLMAFSAKAPEMTLAEVARHTGLARATARRLLYTLEELGFVTSNDRTFALTPHVLDLGYAYLSSLQVGDIAQPYMEALSEQVHESVSAGVLDGDQIVYVARVPTKRIMRIALSLGSRLPALVTSMGRVLIADLPDDQRARAITAAPIPAMTERTITDPALMTEEIERIRAQGWALVDRELEDGVRSISTPLRDRNGRAVAALNIGAEVSRVSTERLVEEFLPLLLEAAREISAQLAKR